MDKINPNLLIHHKVNYSKAFKYAKAMKEGDRFPPVVVRLLPNNKIRVIDGAHRTVAYKLLGIDSIEVYIQGE